MAKLNIPYGIVREGIVLAVDTINVSFTKKEIEELEAAFAANDFSPLLADIPERFYTRICNKALKDLPRLCEANGLVKRNDDMVAFSEVVPESMAAILGDEAATHLINNIKGCL